MSPQLGIDAGVGVDAEKSVVEIDTNDDFVDDTRVEDTLARWTVNVGTPWAAWSGENVRVLLRPGFEYQSEDDFGSFLVDGARVKLNTFAVSGEVEVELNVWENLTVSASHGLEFRSSKLDLPGQEHVDHGHHGDGLLPARVLRVPVGCEAVGPWAGVRRPIDDEALVGAGRRLADDRRRRLLRRRPITSTRMYSPSRTTAAATNHSSLSLSRCVSPSGSCRSCGWSPSTSAPNHARTVLPRTGRSAS